MSHANRILVAGATGALGTHVLQALQSRGHSTRALCRNEAKSSRLASTEIVIGDALRAADARKAVEGVDIVFSCLGQTVSADMSILRPGYRDVDIPANRNLIQAARQAGVRRFVYVSVLHARQFPNVNYFAAHAEVAGEVIRSGMSYAILEPAGFFSAFRAVFDMVQSNGAVLFGEGTSRTNPIDDQDLAGLCVDAVESAESRTIPVGGPEVFTRREIFNLAFAAVGKPARMRQMPLWIPGAIGAASRPFAPRIADLMQFVKTISAEDCIAPAFGKRRLGDYFRGLARPRAA